MRFEVPQFIDIEDKIFGPLTLKQFVYIAGGGGLGFTVYKLLPLYFAAPIILVIAGISWALAFYKLNNQPFINIAQAFIVYITKDKLYVWKKVPQKKQPPKPDPIKTVPLPPPIKKASTQNIKDLARNLDILDKTRYQ